ncbi:DUF302 domain-containing protein [Frigidibacter mobilis]|uniref:Uncharacterized protein n=1 Tax=Frigidibacter mobilis TaxID=1335048 RepID=A0A161HCV4_9RHOB|nr:DUF302 domain-containing protein [Frigidibacter mobilis]AMY71349.1 hypothetical protein AKL17_4133 [Frigidibacter mobilis]
MRSALILTFIALAAPAAAGPAITQTVEDSFDNVAFALESAIVGRGLVIDHLSHVGEMLERTREDVGGTVTVFTQADVFSFCSASVSRQVMEVDPANIQYCPYGIFLYETPDAPGTVTVGYRDYPEGEMQAVEDMLAGIVAEALG